MTERKKGGPVKSGVSYIVGARRPELFVPNEHGQIIPNNLAHPPMPRYELGPVPKPRDAELARAIYAEGDEARVAAENVMRRIEAALKDVRITINKPTRWQRFVARLRWWLA
jgi:hypothetical protein